MEGIPNYQPVQTEFMSQPPIDEILSMLTSIDQGVKYVPSQMLTLGLHFMLNREHPPGPIPELCIFAKKWIAVEKLDISTLAVEAFLLWNIIIQNYERRRYSDSRQAVERILRLAADAGATEAVAALTEIREKYYQYLLANQGKPGWNKRILTKPSSKPADRGERH